MKLHQLVENKNMTPKQAWVNLLAAIDELGEDDDKTLSKTKADETGGLDFIKTLQDQGVVFDADTAMHWAMDSAGSFEVTHHKYKSPKESDSKAGKQLQNFILKHIGLDDEQHMHKIEEALEDGQVTVSLEIFDKAEFNDSKRKFSTIKFGPVRGSSAKATGSKKDLIKFITVEMGQDKNETKDAYPELFK